MTIQFRASSVTGALSSPATVTKPTGTAEGDLLLLHVRTTDNVALSAVPSGFVLVAAIQGTSGIHVYSKVASSSEPADYSVSFPSGTVRLALTAIYSDAGRALELDASASQSNSASTTYTAPSVTTTMADTFLTCFLTISTSVTATAQVGMDKRYESGSSPMLLMTQAVASAGATGTRTATGASATTRAVTAAWKEMLDLPDAPTGLTATPVSTSQINLAWTDNSDNEDEFLVERSADGSTGWTQIATAPEDATSYSNDSLTPATTYYYRVRASNADGESGYSNTANATTDSAAPAVGRYMVGVGHDLDFGALAMIVPQPTSPGVQATSRSYAAGAIHEQGLFVSLEWNLLGNATAYQALLEQFGLDGALSADVTIYARDEVYEWKRYNGTAVRPEMGRDITWNAYYPRGITILVRDLEVIG